MPTVYLASGVFGAGQQFFDSNGKPLNAGRIATFAAGTTTPTATYTTKAGTVANSNPITLNSDGRVPQEMWLVAATGYKFQVVDSVSNLLGTYDDLYGLNDPTTNNAIGYTGATISGALTMNLAPINEAQGANIPVAAQVNLTTATGNYLSLTGSGTVTGIQLIQGAYREFVVNTVSSAFQNSNTMALLGGASFTPAVGDILGFRGEAAPVVRQVLFQRANGLGNVVAVTVSNSLAGNVNLTNSTAYFDGPTTTLGPLGTWLVTGQVTLSDSAVTGGVAFLAKLWDGTTVLASGIITTVTVNQAVMMGFSGVINNPVGAVKISARNSSGNAGQLLANSSLNSKDSTLTAVRLA